MAFKAGSTGSSVRGGLAKGFTYTRSLSATLAGTGRGTANPNASGAPLVPFNGKPLPLTGIKYVTGSLANLNAVYPNSSFTYLRTLGVTEIYAGYVKAAGTLS